MVRFGVKSVVVLLVLTFRYPVSFYKHLKEGFVCEAIAHSKQPGTADPPPRTPYSSGYNRRMSRSSVSPCPIIENRTTA